jgi:hypothetical protein
MLYVAVIGNVNTEEQIYNIKQIFDVPVELLYDSRTVDNDQYTMFEHITAFAIKLQNRVLYNTSPWTTGVSDKAVIILDSTDIDKLSHVDLLHVTNDSVIFDNININANQSWMLGSVHAIIKTCISGKKLQSYFPNGRKSFYIGASGNMFKFIWYSHRNGLKVFCA